MVAVAAHVVIVIVPLAGWAACEARLRLKAINLLIALRGRAPPHTCDAHPSDLDRASAGHNAFGLCVRESVADQLEYHFGRKPCSSIIASGQPSAAELATERFGASA
jgi:hypothetical protein